MALKAGMAKSEIEKEIAGKGTFVQIDRLTRFLREPLTMEMKKFAYQKLAEIYEQAGMFKEGAKMYDNMANLAITFNEKIKHYMKSVETAIKGGDAHGAEAAMNKAIGEANSVQRQEIYNQTLVLFKAQAEISAKSMKRSNAVVIYEKLLQMKITQSERDEIKAKLMDLYEKLGKTKELRHLGGQPITSSTPVVNRASQRPPIPGALRDPRDMGSVRTRSPQIPSMQPTPAERAQSKQDAPKERPKYNDFDVEELWK